MVGIANLPPEVNSARIYAEPGGEQLLAAAVTWDRLAAELIAAAESFDLVRLTASASRAWSGPAAEATATSAVAYVQWLKAAAGCAEQSAITAREAAEVFDRARQATVHPLEVAANRETVAALVAGNILGQSATAIATTEAAYDEMWAQDVAAIISYQVGVSRLIGTSVSPAPSDGSSSLMMMLLSNGFDTALLTGSMATSALLSMEPEAAAGTRSTGDVSEPLSTPAAPVLESLSVPRSWATAATEVRSGASAGVGVPTAGKSSGTPRPLHGGMATGGVAGADRRRARWPASEQAYPPLMPREGA